MKYSSSHEVYETIRKCYSVYAQPRLVAEWDYNRFFVSNVDNDPRESKYGQDVEHFPIESIVEQWRPGKGIIKARVGEGRISWDYFDDPRSPYRSHGDGARYYISSVKDIYKYWSSSEPCNAFGNWPTHADGTQLTVRPFVEYSEHVMCNKIVIGLENTWSSPVNYTIWVKKSGTWSQIASQSNATINAEGRILLWYNSDGWSSTLTDARYIGDEPYGSTPSYGPYDSIEGVQLRVSQMSRPDSYCNVIQISARLERNLTPFLVSADDSFELSDSSQTHPIGKISSNTATVTLSNACLMFNNNNPDTQFQNLLDANVRFNLDYAFDTSQYGQSTTYVQQFEMYSDVWGSQGEENVVVQLRDASKYFQETKPRKGLYEKYTVAEIVWALCDQLGFDKYNIDKRDDDKATSIDIFWTDGESTAWEVFSELCEATQTAIYFDAYGVLQVKTRRAAFNEARSPDWTLYGNDPTSSMLPDILSISKNVQYEANHVTIGYQKTQWSNWQKGLPPMEIVWEPEDSEVLRATPLARTLLKADTFIWIDPKEARHWPYKGIVNIQGELIEYDGKQYRWYTGPNAKELKVINSREEWRNLDPQTPANLRNRNGWTGGLRIVKRGLWNSENKRHPVEAEGYGVRSYIGGNRKNNAKGFRHFKKESVIRLKTGKNFKRNDMLLATRGEDDDAGYYYYGTRMKIDKGPFTNGSAGIVFHSRGVNEAGYFIDVMPTRFTNKRRQTRHEVRLFGRETDGTIRTYGKGDAAQITQDLWIDIDVAFQRDVGPNNDHVISVDLNGVNIFNETISGADRIDWGGKFGVYGRGHVEASFEYLYAINRDEPARTDQSNFFNRIDGGYSSGQWDREWVFNLKPKRKDRITKKDNDKDKERFAGRFMDDFGPIVHEVREYNVKFDPAPVLHSRLYFTNDYEAVCPEYSSDAFSANFIIGNSSRKNAVLNGSDTLRYAGSQNEVNQRMLIFGRAVVVRDSQNVVAKNESAINKRGRIESEIQSRWIQDKTEAERLAAWIRDHWATSVDEITVTTFGNPLIEIGDVVDVDCREHNMTPSNHKYFVISSNTNFSDGMETTLRLRRVQ